MTRSTSSNLRTFSIQTLGCKVNQYEAEQMSTLLISRGLTPATGDAPADLRLVHTCSVTMEAAAKSRQTVRRAISSGRTRSLSLPVLSSVPESRPLKDHAGSERYSAKTRILNQHPGLREYAQTPASVIQNPPSGDSASVDLLPPSTGRVVVTGCWATSDPDAAAALPGVDAVVTHRDDLARRLDQLLSEWSLAARRTDTPSAPADTTRLSHGETRTSEESDPSGRQNADELIGGRISEQPTHLTQTTHLIRPIPLEPVGLRQAPIPARLTGEIIPPPRVGVNEKPADVSTLDRRDGTPSLDPLRRDRQGAEDARTFRPPGATTLPLLSGHQAGRQRAYLKIQDGCDAHCTYCIIPRLRGKPWSKSIENAVDEARRLVDSGHVEIILTGIFLGAFGQETAIRRKQRRMRAEGGRMNEIREASSASSFILPPSSLNLASLVDALCTRVPGLRRLRLSSLEPGDLTDDLLAVLRSHEQVAPHFHLPLQSGSDAILRRMNRQYTADDFRRLIDRVHGAFDRPALTTDAIAGFPGETDADFAATADMVRRAGFIHVHAFPFSPRPGTAAARWTRSFVPPAVASARVAELRALGETQGLAFRRGFVGQTVQLLVERVKPGVGDARHGRCERWFDVRFTDAAAKEGDFVTIRVVDATANETTGVRGTAVPAV